MARSFQPYHTSKIALHSYSFSSQPQQAAGYSNKDKHLNVQSLSIMAVDIKDLPPQVQSQLGRLQQLQQQLQIIFQQRQRIEIKLKGAEGALEELEKTDKDAPIYRNVGSLLIRARSKEEVEKELRDEKETLEIRKKTLESQEGRIKEKSQELQSKIQSALSLAKGAEVP
jgi:prefoldin beta subunit